MLGDRYVDTAVAPSGTLDDVPIPGSVVGLLAADLPSIMENGHNGVHAVTLKEWHAEPGGLTVVAEVIADARTIDKVSGCNVWGSFVTPDDALLVVAALARELPGVPELLELTGVRMLAYEPRRRSARAGLSRPVRLHSGGLTHEAITLDLSRGGCRIFTNHPGDPRNPGAPSNLEAGYRIEIEVELDDGLVLETDALVVRAAGPELALRFTGLAPTDAAEVDAVVFRELVRVTN
jgi:PilZ domain-containing protein